jgi:hypothetical protein
VCDKFVPRESLNKSWSSRRIPETVKFYDSRDGGGREASAIAAEAQNTGDITNSGSSE